jgi:hypothetical protein
MAEISLRYKMWENSSLKKPHFSVISGSVILMRDLLAGYVILCGAGRHWRDSSVKHSHLQGSESLSSDLLHLLRDDIGAEDLSKIYSKIYYV